MGSAGAIRYTAVPQQQRRTAGAETSKGRSNRREASAASSDRERWGAEQASSGRGQLDIYGRAVGSRHWALGTTGRGQSGLRRLEKAVSQRAGMAGMPNGAQASLATPGQSRPQTVTQQLCTQTLLGLHAATGLGLDLCHGSLAESCPEASRRQGAL